MSQEQPRRAAEDPVKYGDVFNVSGEIASQPIAPRDAALMQSAETTVFGQTQKGGPAAVMQSAADVNLSIGAVGHDDITNITRDQGVRLSEGFVGDRHVIAEAVGGEVVGGYTVTSSPGGQVRAANPPAAGPLGDAAITVGEALEATAVVIGNKPVDQSDAAAIQAAEVRATGRGQVIPGGISAEAQAAANQNAQLVRDEDKTKMVDILKDAKEKLPGDKAVTKEDAERVVVAEFRNDPGNSPHPGGVAAAMATAARLNEGPAGSGPRMI